MEYPALRLVILFTTSFVRGKINKIKKSTDVYVDIVLVSMDFETDSVRVELSDNDICIRNMKIPAEVKAFLESN